MEFKKLQIEPESNRFKKLYSSRQGRRTLIAIFVGALAGFLFFYFTEGRHQEILSGSDIFMSTGIGAFFGYFITNSPCARGRC